MSSTELPVLSAPAELRGSELTKVMIERAADGHAPSRKALIDRLLPVVHARVRRQLARGQYGLSGVNDRDLAQEVWLTLWKDDARQLRGWDAARGASLEGYVGMVADREVGNQRQRGNAAKRSVHLVSLQETDEATNALDPESVAIEKDLRQHVIDHLSENLPAKGLAVFRFLYSDGMSPDEVAAVLNVKRQVVYNWQHKIRMLARDVLTPAE